MTNLTLKRRRGHDLVSLAVLSGPATTASSATQVGHGRPWPVTQEYGRYDGSERYGQGRLVPVSG
jgi:hypothetical protein